MGSNRSARQELEVIYGKGDMFKKAKIEEQVVQLKTIKTYKKFVTETRYTGKKIRQLEKNMTYHHLRHQSEGGRATIENGAIVNELAHRYLHSLPREQEEIINNMFRRYKMTGGIMLPTEDGLSVQSTFSIDLDFDIDKEDCLIIEAFDNTPEILEKRNKYNRAKAKRDFKQQVEEELYDKGDDLDDYR
jgi:hypothetical protein